MDKEMIYKKENEGVFIESHQGHVRVVRNIRLTIEDRSMNVIVLEYHNSR